MSDAPEETQIPVACNITELEQREQRQREVNGIFKGVQEVEELEDGYAFRYPGGDEWLAVLVEFIAEERKCCPFFTFELVFEPEQGPIWLKLRGREGVKEFVREAMLTSSIP